MKTAMGNGTSALLSFQKAMAVESHNAGNVKSLAYKADTVSFADMFYSNSVGLGVGMNTPIKDFTQGGLVPTNSEYDFAIDGEGFFTLKDPLNPEQMLYTRAGQFKSDKFNYLSDNNGMRVLGVIPSVSGDVISSEYINNVSSQIVKGSENTTSVNTYTTDYKSTINVVGDYGQVSGSNYKTASSTISDIDELLYQYQSAVKAYAITPETGTTPTKASAEITFPTDPVSDESYTMEVMINGVKFQQNYEDSLENTMKLFSDKISGFVGITSSVDTTTGVLSIESMIPGKKVAITNVKVNNNNLAINKTDAISGTGNALKEAIYTEIQSIFSSVNLNLDNALTNAYNNLSTLDKARYNNSVDTFKSNYGEAKIAENLSSITHPASGVLTKDNLSEIILDLNSLNMNSTLYEKVIGGDTDTVAAYPGIESEDGMLYLRDGDARFLVGYLAPVTFGDKTLLKPEGDSLYTMSDMDAAPVYVENGAKIHGRFLEYSNVDISEQLVNLLSYQKAFEANSKSISTSDEMMKTALALKNK